MQLNSSPQTAPNVKRLALNPQSKTKVVWTKLTGLTLAIILLVPATVYSQEDENPSSGDSQPASIADAEVKALAAKLEELAEQGQSRDLDRIIKWDKVVDRGLAGIPKDESTEAFRKGFLETIGGAGGFSSSIASAATNGGSFHFLRNLTRDGKTIILFRVVLPEGGFNYIEMEVAKENGRVEVVDIYPFSNGEWTSETVRRAYLPFQSKGSDALKESLKENEALLIENANDYSKFGELVSAGEAEKAMELYEKFPVALQKDKSCLLLRLRAAQQLGDDEYGRALAVIRSEYPNDPSSDLLSLDAYVLSKRYADALDCVERLEKRVAGDPFLSLQRAGIKILEKDLDEAERLVKSVMSESDLKLEAYWTLVTISLNRQSFDQTVRLLKEMDANFKIEWADLRQVPDYEEFVKTKYYGDWTDYLKSKQQLPLR